MCECITIIESKMLDKFKEEVEHKEIMGSGFDNEGFIISPGLQIQNNKIAMPFTISYTKTTKKGRLQTRNQTQNVFPSYCGFCGEKFDKKEGE